MSRLLLTTEYDPDYVIAAADGSPINLCDGSFIVTYQDRLLALACNREQKLGLHLLAANAGVPTTLLEHPTRAMFTRVVREGKFDVIGFSALVPSLEKIAEMINICRAESPRSRLVLGGHGVEHDSAGRVGADLVCRGDGISYLHELFGTEPGSFRHPVLPYRHSLKVLMDTPPFGRRGKGTSFVLCCSVGCPMGCEYCPVSSFYDRGRFTYLDGDTLVATMFEIAARHRKSHFFLWDQDFLLDLDRYRRLSQAVRAHNRECARSEDLITWSTQVSIRTLSQMDLDEMFDSGCRFLSIGVEASDNRWAKRAGRDPSALFDELHRRGIGTFAFFIIGWEDHDVPRMRREIDYLLALNPTINHFTLLTPEPGTEQYKNWKAEGKLLDLPTRCFNYATLQFKHPLVTAEEARTALNDAYVSGRQQLGASVLRTIALWLTGLKATRTRLGSDAPEAAAFRAGLKQLLPVVYLLPRFLPEGVSAELAHQLRGDLKQAGVTPGAKGRMQIAALNAIMAAHQAKRRVAGVGFRRWQPSLIRYDAPHTQQVVQPKRFEALATSTREDPPLFRSRKARPLGLSGYEGLPDQQVDSAMYAILGLMTACHNSFGRTEAPIDLEKANSDGEGGV